MDCLATCQQAQQQVVALHSSEVLHLLQVAVYSDLVSNLHLPQQLQVQVFLEEVVYSEDQTPEPQPQDHYLVMPQVVDHYSARLIHSLVVRTLCLRPLQRKAPIKVMKKETMMMKTSEREMEVPLHLVEIMLVDSETLLTKKSNLL